MAGRGATVKVRHGVLLSELGLPKTGGFGGSRPAGASGGRAGASGLRPDDGIAGARLRLGTCFPLRFEGTKNAARLIERH